MAAEIDSMGVGELFTVDSVCSDFIADCIFAGDTMNDSTNGDLGGARHCLLNAV